MSALKSLVFAPLPKLSGADPVQHRRNKLIERLRQQISLANDPTFALTRQKWVSDGNGGKNLQEQRKRVRPWWRMDGSGNVVLTVRYGARPIEFDKGKAAIAVGKKEKLVSTIETVISAVEAGELDTAIGHMSKTAVQLKSKKAA